MSKLYKLRKWLTLNETAKHLSQVLSERVYVADVLLLALDGHLPLSLRLSNLTYAKPLLVVRIDEVEYEEVTTLDEKSTIKLTKGGPLFQLHGLEVAAGECLQLSEKVITLDTDVWRLPMTETTRLCVSREYQRLTGGAPVTDVSLDGIVVENMVGDYFQLQAAFCEKAETLESNNWREWKTNADFYPAASFPDDDFSAVVILTQDLTKFLKSLEEGNDKPIESSVGTRERDTLYKIIIGMAIRGYGHNPAAMRSNAIADIVRDLEHVGVPVSDDTVRKYIKEAAKLLEGKH